MADKMLQEEILCVCGHKMEYQGLETSVLADDTFSSASISDLEVFLCSICENKIWVHKVSNSSPLQQEMVTRIQNVVESSSQQKVV